MKKDLKIDIKGMHCASCSALIELSLKNKNGINGCSVNLVTNSASVEIDDSLIQTEDVIKIIENSGYKAEINEGGKKKH